MGRPLSETLDPSLPFEHLYEVRSAKVEASASTAASMAQSSRVASRVVSRPTSR